MDQWNAPGDGEEEPHFFLPDIDELTLGPFDEESSRPVEKVSSPPPGFAKIDVAARERSERRKRVANEWLSLIQELSAATQLPSILEAVEACGAQETTLKDVNVAQFAFALGETDCVEAVRRLLIRRLNGLQTGYSPSSPEPGGAESDSLQPELPEKLESSPLAQYSPTLSPTDVNDVLASTRLRTRESDGSGGSSATTSTGRASSITESHKEPLPRDDSFVEREKVILGADASHDAKIERLAENSSSGGMVEKGERLAKSTSSDGMVDTGFTGTVVPHLNGPSIVAQAITLKDATVISEHEGNSSRKDSNDDDRNEQANGQMKMGKDCVPDNIRNELDQGMAASTAGKGLNTFVVGVDAAVNDVDTDGEEEDDDPTQARTPSPTSAVSAFDSLSNVASEALSAKANTLPAQRSPVVEKKRPKKKKKKVAPVVVVPEQSNTVSPHAAAPNVAEEVVPERLLEPPTPMPSALKEYLEGAWTIIREAHRMAYDSDRELKYILITIACFPELVRWTIGLYAPSWASVCLFYAFLIQVLCTSTSGARGWKVAVLRKIIPLAFLLDGVSHPSLLLGFDRYELLITANLISAIKYVDSLNPMVVLTVAFQVIFALLARDVVCRSSSGCDFVMLYLQGLFGICGIIIAKTF